MMKQTVLRGMMGFPCRELPEPHRVWEEALAADIATRRTLYIHIPYCRSRCPFCPFYLGGAGEEETAEYVRLLRLELERWGELAGRFPVNAVYFGGGTPSDLGAESLVSLLDAVRKNYRLAADCEITVEGRIDGFEPEKARRLAAHGANRLSIGIQTFDTELRRRLGRVSARRAILGRLEALAAINEFSLVVDLLYALPGQTAARWEADLATLLASTRVSGLDLYRLKVSDTLPLAAAIRAGKLPPVPDDETAYAMHLAGVEAMRSAGAVRISPVHFAFDARERNLNNTVSSSKQVCLQFGMKAVGRLAGRRFMQHSEFRSYRELVSAGRKPVKSAGLLPPDFAACGELAGQIYRPMRIFPGRVAAAAPAAFRERVETAVRSGAEHWAERGFLTAEPGGGFALTERANFSHREMASDLMERIAEACS